jgi:hypothetical protein
MVFDEPLGDPNVVVIRKVDNSTGAPYGKDDPHGLSLAGAIFTWRYYDGMYDTAEEAAASGAPTRTWLLETKAGGVAMYWDADPDFNYLAPGSDAIYHHSGGGPMIPLGTVVIQETTPPPGYLLPNPNPLSVLKIEQVGNSIKKSLTTDGQPVDLLVTGNTLIQPEKPHTVTVEKYDADNDKPLANTEFTLYKETAKGSGVWTRVTTHVTNMKGKCVFSPVVVGSYKLIETRPDPIYATVEESGGVAERYFDISASSTGEVQVFQNDAIQISCEVYKQTIALTSSALDATVHGLGNNVGQEEYLYHFGGRSTSKVRADEFAITDDLAFVNAQGYYMTTLWTGTSPTNLDHDNLMTILYKTNYSDEEIPHFSYHPLSANPYNANNLDRIMVFSDTPGWRIWKEQVATTVASRLDVADLDLAAGEYITGLKIVYGGVEPGFYAGNGWEKSDDPHTVKQTRVLGAQGVTAAEDFYYSVVATRALEPIDAAGNETVMRGSIRADIARNAGVLTDNDVDAVQTRVIGSFSHEYPQRGVLSTYGSYGGSLPRTGDTLHFYVVAAVCLAGLGVGLLVVRYKRTTKDKQND